MKRSQIITILIFLITISSVNQWTDLPLDNTFFWWIIYGLLLFYFVKCKKFFFREGNNKYLYVLFTYLIWMVICIIRGMFVADNYWEWKNLIHTSMFLLIPLSIYVTTNKIMVQKIIFVWLKYALPTFFILYYFLHTEAIGRYLIPISFLFLFFPVVNRKWKFILIFFTLIIFFTDINARSNVIKFALPVILCCLYYVRSFIGNKVINAGRLMFLFLPIILLGLGLAGIFNPFKMDEYIEGDYKTVSQVGGEELEEDLTADTRTFLYVEVLESAIKHKYVLFGRTPARGNDSASFGLHQMEELNTGKMERFSNEVSILNIFTWTGLLGVVLYFLIFFNASYLAINKSHNIFMKIIGLYISFRWAYSWVEDFSTFNISNIFLWISIGMCFSKSFCNMTNIEMKIWVRGIFNIRYQKLEYFNLQRKKEWLLKK